jgi:hypothetical protein
MPKADSVLNTQGLIAPEIPDLSLEQLSRAIGKLRSDARDEINRLLKFIDETDNHTELEPEDEDDDAELEDSDPAEDDGLQEPSLGSLGDHHPNQARWAAGGRRDLEQDDGETGIGDLDGLLEHGSRIGKARAEE